MKKPLAVPKVVPTALIGFMIALPVLGTACQSGPEAEVKTTVIPVELATIEPSSVKTSTAFVGYLEAAQIAEVRPEIQGRVERIAVVPGQSVSAGQILITLKPDQTLPQFQGSLAAIDVAKGARENAIKGLDVAKAERDTARSNLRLTVINTERARQLVADGAIAQIYFDEVAAKQEAARNTLKAAEEKVAAARVAVMQAEAKIREAQAEARSSQVNLGFKDVVAPIAGVVDNILVKVGDYVTTGQPVTRIAQSNVFDLNIKVPAERANQLSSGLTVELLDPNTRQKLTVGKIAFISPTVQSNEQGILVKAQFPNVNNKLRDGQFVEAQIVWNTQPGMLVPTSAISRVSGKSFIFVVDDNSNPQGQQIVRLKPVELGPIQDNRYQVKSGLSAGDRIAVTNILKLRDGVAIEVQSQAQAAR